MARSPFSVITVQASVLIVKCDRRVVATNVRRLSYQICLLTKISVKSLVTGLL